MKKNVLVTGGAGFIGSHLVEKILQQSFKVHLLIKPSTDLWRIKEFLDLVKLHNVDLTNKAELTKVIKRIKPDYIFHLATHGSYPTQPDPDRMIETNIKGTLNLLNALEDINYKNLIVAGSSSEYGKKTKPMKETDLPEPNNYYGATKAAQTLLTSSWSKVHNKPCVILRFFAAYGPKEEEGRLVRNVIEAALNGQPIKLATGNEARDFIYTADVTDACILAMKKVKARGDVYNIGTGQQTTIKQLAEAVVRLTQSKSKILLNIYRGRSWDSFTWVANMTKTKSQLKFKARLSLTPGLKNTIEWYKNQE